MPTYNRSGEGSTRGRRRGRIEYIGKERRGREGKKDAMQERKRCIYCMGERIASE